jgi:hypothetical protein
LLKRHFATRTGVPIAPASLPRVRSQVRSAFPASVEEASARAGRLRRGRFDLLGYPDLDFALGDGSLPASVDWHLDPVHRRRAPRDWWSRVRFLDPGLGDHKIIWELNRHQHFLALGRAAWLTGDPSHRGTFVAHLQGWMAQNLPGIGINWASMLELSFRSLSWLWALQLFAAAPESPENGEPSEPSWIPNLLLGLHAQLRQVERNLSRYFSPNTHLTGEALGLYVCGTALPELRDARRWAETGRSVLLEQIPLQVAADGGHCERSTHYLRYTLDFYLLALAIARAAGDAALPAFEHACSRTARAARALADSHGRLPLIGDDDGGRLWAICDREPNDVRDSLALAAVLLEQRGLAVGPPPEEPFWILGLVGSGPVLRQDAAPDPGQPSAHREAVHSRSVELPETGYYIARPRPDDHLVIDAGPHGFLNGGHAHADALSLVYTLRGLPLAIDPGTFTYTMSPAWRDRLRSSPSHNTLTLDGRSQSVPDGPFSWRNEAGSRVQAWVAGDGYHYFEGAHDGYLPSVHRRRVVSLDPGILVVIDSVLGNAEHRADVHWHIDRGWTASRRGEGKLLLAHHQGARSWLITPGTSAALLVGDEARGLGWQSPVYGRLLPCSTVRVTASGSMPLRLVSVFAEAAGEMPPGVQWLGVPRDADGWDDGTGVLLETGGRRHALLFISRAALLPGRNAGGAEEAATARFDLPGTAVATSARFAWLTTDGAGGWCVKAAVDGEVTFATGAAAPRVSKTA